MTIFNNILLILYNLLGDVYQKYLFFFREHYTDKLLLMNVSLCKILTCFFKGLILLKLKNAAKRQQYFVNLYRNVNKIVSNNHSVLDFLGLGGGGGWSDYRSTHPPILKNPVHYSTCLLF